MMSSCFSFRNERSPPNSRISHTSNDTVREPSISDSKPECTKPEQEDGKTSGPVDHDIPSSSASAVHADEYEEILITNIRAIDLARGLTRIPIGFYVVLQHSSLQWRTANSHSSVNNNVVEWDGPIPIPSDLSAIVHLEINASFESDPTLGNREQLRELAITVEQLLDHSAKDLPFRFFPEDGDIVFPCSSLSVAVRRQKRENCDPSLSGVLDPQCSVTECRDQLRNATDEVCRALSRNQKHRGKRDLKRSIEQFERALIVCPLDHPCRAATKSNMALAEVILYKVNNSGVSLDIPLTLFRRALSTRPVGHPDRPSALIHLAILHLARFEKRQDGVDGAQAETLLHQAMELSSADCHEKWAASSMLQWHAGHKKHPVRAGAQSHVERGSGLGLTCGERWTWVVQLLTRYEQFGNLDDLQQAISLLEGLVMSTSFRDPRYPRLLQNLGGALSHRFRRLGQETDIHQAILRHSAAVDLTPNVHPDKPIRLNNLGSCFATRFEHLGELRDLERATAVLREAVDLNPNGRPHKPTVLNNLGLCFRLRFERLGDLADLERAVSTLMDAVDLAPDGHPDKHEWLNHLGLAFRTRFERLGKLTDLNQAISKFGDAVNLTPDSHPNRPLQLNDLGLSFRTRFEYLGELHDLERVIVTLREAINLTPDGRPHKPAMLSNLGLSFTNRFQRLGEVADLDLAISTLRDAVHLSPDSHPQKPTWLNNLGTSFLVRFKRFGEFGDLEGAISTLGDAVNQTPDGHHDKCALLNNLGNAFSTRFEHIGELSDLERAISALVVAVDLTPDGRPDKHGLLGNLGNFFLSRFERLGNLSDLDRAISRYWNAVDLTPDGHLNKPRMLCNLGGSLVTRFKRLGELSDLEQAISLQRDAVRLTPDGHPEKSRWLHSLGHSFTTRFERLGECNDLERAISVQVDAIDVMPDGHPDKSSLLNSLGNSLLVRFEHLGELTDLERAISLQEDAVHLTPIGHPQKRTWLNNLSASFHARFQHLGEISDLERAISTIGNALDLTPDGHPGKPHCLDNLGTAFRTRFKRLGELGDLERAISRFEDAAQLTPEGHPDKPRLLNKLGSSLLTRFERLEEPSDLERAISLFSHSVSHTTSPAPDRLDAALLWISCARLSDHQSLLHAYSVAIGLLPQLAWIGLSFPHRYRELLQGADIVREAAAVALESGYPETAVEWLEQGRSIVWGELVQLRSSYDELSAVHPNHARKLRELSTALEQASAAREKTLSSLSEITPVADHHATDKHRALAIERDKLLKDIRSLPGFGRFLLHKEYSRLRASAHSGPIVILNAAESRCDALIVLADVENVIHVPLPNFTLVGCEALQKATKCLVRDAHVIPVGERVGHRMPQEIATQWESILSPLWKCVVKPVLDTLVFMAPGKQSRIFWCPTGPFTFLPIHAAGFYDAQYSQVGHKLFDFVVSSYVPTLSILAPSPSPHTTSSGNLRFLAIRQPASDGLSYLPGVVAELRHITAIIGNSPATTLFESSAGTVEEVLALMMKADWVHFACHGIQDTENPTESGLCLADRRRLKLSDIIALSRPHGGLVFLSACQTATGDKDLSDEAIHIAAGMLFAGFGGVIGTMWSISDRLAPDVARHAYEQLFQTGTRPDYREAARALQDAVGRLRNNGASFSDWLPFIHVGL